MSSRIGMTCVYYDGQGGGPFAAVILGPNNSEMTVTLKVFGVTGPDTIEYAVPYRTGALGATDRRYWSTMGT